MIHLFQWLFSKFLIQLLKMALQIYVTEVSNWQAVTQILGVGLLGLSDFF